MSQAKSMSLRARINNYAKRTGVRRSLPCKDSSSKGFLRALRSLRMRETL